MTSLRELRNEHAEVVNRLSALEGVIWELVKGQLLEGLPVVHQTAEFIEKAIIPHFVLEETLLFPILARGSTEAQRLREELLVEHLSLRDSFLTFIRLSHRRVASEDFTRICWDMMARLAIHARKEDIFLLPAIRELLFIDEITQLPAHAPSLLYKENGETR